MLAVWSLACVVSVRNCNSVYTIDFLLLKVGEGKQIRPGMGVELNASFLLDGTGKAWKRESVLLKKLYGRCRQARPHLAHSL